MLFSFGCAFVARARRLSYDRRTITTFVTAHCIRFATANRFCTATKSTGNNKQEHAECVCVRQLPQNQNEIAIKWKTFGEKRSLYTLESLPRRSMRFYNSKTERYVSTLTQCWRNKSKYEEKKAANLSVILSEIASDLKSNQSNVRRT